jgi:hypothetical protein
MSKVKLARRSSGGLARLRRGLLPEQEPNGDMTASSG